MKSPLVIREDFDWKLAIPGWLILAMALGCAVFWSVLAIQSHDTVIRVIWFAGAACMTALFLVPLIITREEIYPWVFRHRQTSKSSPPSPSLSSSLLALHNSLTALSQPNYLSTSRSLPSVTVEQPVVGFRVWRLGSYDERLYSLTSIVPAPWQTATTAICGAGQSHPAPQAGCQCGLYAHFAPQPARWPASGSLAGAVLASGRILRHPKEGIRAERMRLLALVHPPLEEKVLEPCSARPSVPWETAGRMSPAELSAMGPWIDAGPSTGGYYLLGHRWETEDRELNLPTGVHRFKAKLKCQHCGCGPEREFTVVDHTPDLAALEQIARQYGVPVVPSEKIATYAAEFGIIASEVKALTEAKS